MRVGPPPTVGPPSWSRRLALASALPCLSLFVARPAPAIEGSASLVRGGMAAFAANHVEESVKLYDLALAEKPSLAPYLWQRGLALYYADRFADGAAQFARDVAVNPNDTEEQIWHLLCLARAKGGSLEAARASRLAVGVDRRPVMRAAQALFLSGGAEEQAALAEFARGGDPSAKFYAELYLGLYEESLGNASAAEQHVREATRSEYARGGGAADPMAQLARVHMQRRGWAVR